MTSDDLKRIFLGPTLFRLDTMLSPRLVPVLYATGLAATLIWAVKHLFAAFGSSFGNGLWGLLEIVVFGAFFLVVLRTVCEAMLVYFKANETARDDVSRERVGSSLLDDVRDAIHDIAGDTEDEDEDVDDLIMPATDPAPDIDEAPPPRNPRRTARRTPGPRF